MTASNKITLKWPDDLCRLWDIVHEVGESSSSANDPRITKVWERLVNDLTLALQCDSTVGKFYPNDGDARGMALDFLVFRLRDSPRPVNITGKGALIVELKKFGVKEKNRHGYEVYKVLSQALHELERSKRLVQYGADTRYRNSTIFGLATSPFARVASADEEKHVDSRLPMFGPKTRNEDTDRKQLLSKTDAVSYILKVFSLLDGGVYITLDQLQRIAVNHVRNFPKLLMKPYDPVSGGGDAVDMDDPNAVREAACDLGRSSMEVQDRDFEKAELEDEGDYDAIELMEEEESFEDEETNAQSADEDGDAESSAHDSFGESGEEKKGESLKKRGYSKDKENEYAADESLWMDVMLQASHEARDRIWQEVTRRAGTKLFCLYSLPKWDPQLRESPKYKLNHFGDPRRVNDHSQQQWNLFAKEIKGLPTNPGKGNGVAAKACAKDDDKSGDADFVRKLRLLGIREIFNGLIGRCTENGLNPRL